METHKGCSGALKMKQSKREYTERNIGVKFTQEKCSNNFHTINLSKFKEAYLVRFTWHQLLHP